MSQRWEVAYVDEIESEPVAGELNEDFGLYVERDFHIVTAMASHRYIDLIEHKRMVLKTPNGFNT
jgi:hypothetical protein